MKVIFICQAVDLEDKVQATTVSWIRALYNNPLVDSVTVLSLRVGRHNLPSKIDVIKIGGGGTIFTLINFYKQIFKIKKKDVTFFVYQNGFYPLLLLPFRLVFGIPVFQWLAHPHNSWLTRWNIRIGANCVFTSTPYSLPIKHRKVMVIGQGVDLDQFQRRNVDISDDLITVGRVTEIKQIDFMLKILEAYHLEYGRRLRLRIVGEAMNGDDVEYMSYLKREVAAKKLESCVAFMGGATQKDIPELLSQARIFLFFCKGALGRSAIEAMACEVPVVTSNICVGEILGEGYKNSLYCNSMEPHRYAKMIHNILVLDESAYKSLGLNMRKISVSDHSVDGLFEKIMMRIKQDA